MPVDFVVGFPLCPLASSQSTLKRLVAGKTVDHVGWGSKHRLSPAYTVCPGLEAGD